MFVPVTVKPLSTDDLQDALVERLNGPRRPLLNPVIEARPDAIEFEELARASGYESGGGAFNNTRGSLRSLGLVEYPRPGEVVARDVRFLD